MAQLTIKSRAVLNRGDLRSPIATDLRCCRCGYNLRTLSTSGKCPECGASVAESIAAANRRRAFTGWWVVLMLLVPALVLHSSWPALEAWYGDAKSMALLAGDAAIGARAVVGAARRHGGHWWIMYALLYLALVPIVEAVVALAGNP